MSHGAYAEIEARANRDAAQAAHVVAEYGAELDAQLDFSGVRKLNTNAYVEDK
eukprot:CAMPEP_0115337092 /NCGR_PEP_ID=MMETSP0270-20121206/89345_1 /TAXON_ID=71861 /ORGANISM="Scrippsiella trochoidea, Strain CCMP3099" /LENGTH=52 /DNA_ID=CAMNT_0002758289 /DNA_START=2195 /DNA_END=2353 /DNA_ORIENTATION=-